MSDNKIIDFNKAKKETTNVSTSNDKKITTKKNIDKEVEISPIIDINEKENKKLKEKLKKESIKKEKEILKERERNKNKSSKIKSTYKQKEEKKEISLGIFEDKASKTKNAIFDVLLCILAFVLFFIVAINLPIFNVNDINVNGNSSVSTDEIKELINYDENKNFFFLYFKPLDEMILENPMIKNVQVRYTFPNQITIKVDEIVISGYIPYLDEYVYIDSTGKVVNISNEILPNIPLINGLTFSSFSLGNVLDVTNKESLSIIIELANIINKYMINTNIATIDIMQTDDIRIIYGKVEIVLGTMEDCDYKIRKAIEIIKKLPDAYGYLDVSSKSNRSVFTFK